MPESAERRSAFANGALFAGIGLLMLGSGLTQSLLGVRATSAGFGTTVTGIVLSAYYVGFLVGSVSVPPLIRHVGHIRVFTALVSMGSAAVLIHAVFVDPVTWGVVRLVTGICLAGVFVTAESWLNHDSTNETRGRVLAVYMLVVLGGIGIGQLLLNAAPVSGSTLFILSSVLISAAVVPVALIPRYGPVAPERSWMPVADVFHAAPLGVVVSMIGGAVSGALIGFGAVYATESGLSVGEVSLFMAAVLFGGAALQWPLGALSDRLERRQVIALTGGAVTLLAAGAAMVGSTANVGLLIVMAAGIGGLGLPLYSLAVSHANDYLQPEQIVGATSVLVLCSGAGAVAGPIAASAAVSVLGPPGFFWSLVAMAACVVVYALYRMAVRPSRPRAERATFGLVPLTATPTISELHPVVHDPGPVSEHTVGSDPSLKVVVQGEGPPVVFLHGAGSSHRIWRAMVTELAAVGYRCVAYDLRGHGDSEQGPAGRLDDHVADLGAVLSFVGSERAHLVAADEGSAVAFEAALTDPRRIRSVTVVGVPRPSSTDGGGPVDALRRVLESATPHAIAGRMVDRRAHPELFGSVAEDQKRADRERRAELVAAADADKIVARLGDLRVPLLVVVGDHERNESRVVAQRMAAEAPGGRARSAPDAARLVPLEAPAPLGRALRSFLEEVAAGEPSISAVASR